MITIPFYGLVMVPNVTYFFQKEYFDEVSNKAAEANEKVIFIMQKEEKKMREKESKLSEISNARMKDIDINDKNRVKVIKWLKNFYDSFEKVNTLKGLYLHGSFGSGKTYLIAALLNELEKNKDASIEIVYFPEVLRNMKEDFSLAQDKVNYYQNVDILLIDKTIPLATLANPGHPISARRIFLQVF